MDVKIKSIYHSETPAGNWTTKVTADVDGQEVTHTLYGFDYYKFVDCDVEYFGEKVHRACMDYQKAYGEFREITGPDVGFCFPDTISEDKIEYVQMKLSVALELARGWKRAVVLYEAVKKLKRG